ncbi:unnamed protein product [Parnassius mnemosyne]|uniref:Endonuclease/exonuclease/phosphatase domain-containing protein n=1 Tax=Parnassius mnemosyne TaxID=213953 RepID=A0AAV1LSS0_9NEOP
MSFNNDNLDDSFFSLSDSDGLSSNDSYHSIPSLSEILDSHFSDTLKNFNVVHINAQSIPAHYPDMLSSFYNENIHAILVSESWLEPCLPSTSYSLPGFHLIRNDRLGCAGGGVAIYLRSHIPYTVLNTSQPLSSAGPEHLFIEILFGHLKLLLGVFYSPNVTIDYFSSFEILLEQYSSLYNHTIVMGDFNTCLLKNYARASRLKSLVNGINLHILPHSATHAFPNCVPSLLDLILVSSIDHVAKHGQCNASAFSYHDLLYLCYKLKPPKAKQRILLRRNFSRMDLDKLREDTAKVDWSVVANAVDEQISIFNSILTQLYDIHAPIRTVRMKHLPAPCSLPT